MNNYVNKPPLVSVIIPVFNAAEFLPKTFEHISNQSYKNIEIICINDGSTDDSLNVLKEIKQLYKTLNIIILSQQNKRAAAARNYGLSVAKGKYIQFLDADDYMSKDKISKQVAILEQENELTLTFCKWKSVRLGKILDEPQTTYKDYDIPIELIIDFYKYDEMLPLHSFLTPKKLINISGKWDESITTDDDGEFFTRIISNAHKVVYDNNSTVYYRRLNNSYSQVLSLNGHLKLIKAFRKKTKTILYKKNDKETQFTLKQHFTYLYEILYLKDKKVASKIAADFTFLSSPLFVPYGSKINRFLIKILGINNTLKIKALLYKKGLKK